MKQSFSILESSLFYSLIFFLPTQLGKHFWPDFAYVHGLRIDYLSPTVYFTDVLVGLFFIVWMFKKLGLSSSKKYQISNIKFQISKLMSIGNWKFESGTYLILILFLLINIHLSNRIPGGQYSLFKLTEMSFLAYYTAKFISDRSRFDKTLLMFCLSAITESIMAIFQFLIHGSIGGPVYVLRERTFNSTTPGIANASINGELILRPYGTFSHPNVLAGYLVVVMILVLFAVKTEQNIKFKSLYASGMILGSVALFLTLSRVAILVWILILFNCLIKYIHRHPGKRSASRISKRESSLPAGRDSGPIRPAQGKQARMTKSISLSVVLIGVVTLFFLTPLGSRFTSLNLADEAVVARQELMESSLKMINASPLLGVGLGNFIPTLARQQKPLTVGTNLQPVHNIFLLIAAETGLIGLGFFMWLIFKIYQRLFYCHPELARHERGRMVSGSKKMPKLVRHDRPAGLIIAISSILALGMFDHYWLTLQQGQLLFAIIIGISFSNFKKTAHKSS